MAAAAKSVESGKCSDDNFEVQSEFGCFYLPTLWYRIYHILIFSHLPHSAVVII